ncbi:hypothetical protein H0H81_002613 [Sphagnurus paluster]|uniref:Uncharacterized protein n=1 Tax=Sphagnurus paluster TaxID=117069 RepID=A0A9P7GQZ9_9AGAR|nr:hypothetical protein H0H81_002613 [Sphagnurus paluster]
MPTIGVAKLSRQPKESDLFDTDKERVLYTPRDTTWTEIGEECALDGIGVNMVLAPSKFMDIGSIGVVASLTGGDLLYHPRFDSARDEPVLNSQLQRLMRRMQGYNCVMRIRCSNGMQISRTHYGNFCQTSPTNLEFGILDADKTISITLEHSGKSLTSRDSVFLQASLLYTTLNGERRARICNLALPVAELAMNVYQFADMETTLCHLAREGQGMHFLYPMQVLILMYDINSPGSPHKTEDVDNPRRPYGEMCFDPAWIQEVLRHGNEA